PDFTFYPFWNSHGQADRVSHVGSSPVCDWSEPGSRVPNMWTNGCARYDMASNVWTPYQRVSGPKGSWQGSLLTDKQDASGTLFRRNRYYDPKSGRFTQEDPIGLAGGMNL